MMRPCAAGGTDGTEDQRGETEARSWRKKFSTLFAAAVSRGTGRCRRRWRRPHSAVSSAVEQLSVHRGRYCRRPKKKTMSDEREVARERKSSGDHSSPHI